MKAQGLARIGRDVEVRTIQNGELVANISLAFEYGKKDSSGKRKTQWIDASLWGKRAESLAPYLKKGNQVVAYLEDVCLSTFTGKDGKEGTKMEARISDIELVKAPRDQETKSEPKQKQVGFDDLSDDVPF
jgi:single-strand DNA-binding protein